MSEVNTLKSVDACASLPVGESFKLDYELLAHYGCLNVLGRTFTLHSDDGCKVRSDGSCPCAFAYDKFACSMFPCQPTRRSDGRGVVVVELMGSDGE